VVPETSLPKLEALIRPAGSLVRPEDTAVLLNANARRVSRRMRRELGRVVPAENLYITHSLDEAEAAAQGILARGYKRIVAGGGDGTLSLLMDHLCRAVEAAPAGAHLDLPAIGVLKLGTGNALASHVGAGAPRNDLPLLHDEAEAEAVGALGVDVPLHLIEAAGRLAFFAGAGVDAMILNDYLAIKRRLRRHLARFGEGIVAYFGAAFGRTVPRLVTTARSRPVVTITNLGRPAWRLSERGLPVGDPLPAGAVLHEGPALMTSGATLPYYGAGMVMFPWACDRAGHMQLRVANPPVSHIVAHLPDLWTGTYAHDSIQDFHVTHVRMEFDRPTPVQVAGDGEGWQESLELRVSEHTIPLIHLN